MFHLATEKANASGRSVLDAVPDFELPTKPKPRLDFLREAEMLALLEELPARLYAFIKFFLTRVSDLVKRRRSLGLRLI
jgi:hypothetical protein